MEGEAPPLKNAPYKSYQGGKRRRLRALVSRFFHAGWQICHELENKFVVAAKAVSSPPVTAPNLLPPNLSFRYNKQLGSRYSLSNCQLTTFELGLEL
ncbi:MAG: hypothetical protein DMG06_09615 [Acidobacteria bacterium]|nr:MAG: hypothetical protein DMG06_09615 [Acidobacteriota bacterium]